MNSIQAIRKNLEAHLWRTARDQISNELSKGNASAEDVKVLNELLIIKKWKPP